MTLLTFLAFHARRFGVASLMEPFRSPSASAAQPDGAVMN
jgi:hypothetical protein